MSGFITCYLTVTYVVEFQANRNSWPFKQPVDPGDVPNYYKVVKEPMGKQFIEISDWIFY